MSSFIQDPKRVRASLEPRMSHAAERKALPTGPAAGADLATGLRFGVEIEHHGLSCRQVGALVADTLDGTAFDAHTIRTPDLRIWRIDHDAGGVELVTPVLQGREDLHLVQKMVTALKSAGASADERAGLHVHIDAARLHPPHLQALIGLMAHNEHWLYPLWGVHAKRRNEWCQNLSPELAAVCLDPRLESSRQRLGKVFDGCRFYGLNLQNTLQPGQKGTIEFRYLNGTLDPCAIGCAVGFFMALTERALQIDQVEAAATAGQSCLPALLQQLNLSRSHPVGAHLMNLLRERIEQGWQPDLPGPKPNVAVWLADDHFVSTLCTMLLPSDTANQVAVMAHLLAAKTPKQRDALVASAGKFCTELAAFARRPSMGLAMRLVAQHHLSAEDMRSYLLDIGEVWADTRLIDTALSIFVAHIHRRPHLQNALRVAQILEEPETHDRLWCAESFLGWSEASLRGLRDLLDAMPPYGGRRIGYRIADAIKSGIEPSRLQARLLADGRLLQRNPHLCLATALDTLADEEAVATASD